MSQSQPKKLVRRRGETTPPDGMLSTPTTPSGPNLPPEKTSPSSADSQVSHLSYDASTWNSASCAVVDLNLSTEAQRQLFEAATLERYKHYLRTGKNPTGSSTTADVHSKGRKWWGRYGTSALQVTMLIVLYGLLMALPWTQNFVIGSGPWGFFVFVFLFETIVWRTLVTKWTKTKQEGAKVERQ